VNGIAAINYTYPPFLGAVLKSSFLVLSEKNREIYQYQAK
jgi:hypothetical protein